jgi:hypothetical protein
MQRIGNLVTTSNRTSIPWYEGTHRTYAALKSGNLPANDNRGPSQSPPSLVNRDLRSGIDCYSGSAKVLAPLHVPVDSANPFCEYFDAAL